MTKHCENCKCEDQQEELPISTNSLEKQFGNLICRKIEQFGVAFKDIKIPKGWNIPTMAEGIQLVNDEEFVNWCKFEDRNHDFYVKQPFKRNEGKSGAWLGCYYSGHFDCYSDVNLNLTYALRGVLLVKRVEE